jgi:protein-tyrosine phosphatase
MIDLHTHVLPGIDDGVETVEEAVALGRAAAADGVVTLAATPHVRADYPTRPGQMEALVQEVARAFRENGVPVQVLGGAEIGYESLATLPYDELRRFGLGGNPDVLLIEFPYVGWPLQFGSRLRDLRDRGFLPVLAHPERNPAIQAAPERIRPAIDAGALVQLTVPSLNGSMGRTARRASLRLLELRYAHMVASDAHGRGKRSSSLGSVESIVGDSTLARWLTTDVPDSVVAGRPLPTRPPGRRASWRSLWRREDQVDPRRRD